ncbi:LytR/AlgR family response regulator transcription factor [Pleionea sediminis]|uniref:LytR/AlgR family response regulator transcription factor n=1 Tax=Pleionea sediminis TaxID=2569479 RepID=UPI0011854FA7|nr:LytTR family DNA-binding domain-containing protein [Pleionea sediminis]
MKRVMIVDDELSARQNIKEVIDFFNELEIVSELSDGISAISEIDRLRPDIVFLDIQMPEINGFQVAQKTSHINYQLVFFTAYPQYALDAFSTNAIDFLLKPIRPHLLKRCIDKILRQERMILEILKNSTDADTLALSDGNTSRIINIENINHIEGLGRYRRVHLTKEGERIHQTKTIISDTTLDEFESQLSKVTFLRVHRSYIINTNYITNILRENRRHYLSLEDSTDTIPISRGKYPLLKSRFNL